MPYESESHDVYGSQDRDESLDKDGDSGDDKLYHFSFIHDHFYFSTWKTARVHFAHAQTFFSGAPSLCVSAVTVGVFESRDCEALLCRSLEIPLHCKVTAVE